jgi:hypothetical protein
VLRRLSDSEDFGCAVWLNKPGATGGGFMRFVLGRELTSMPATGVAGGLGMMDRSDRVLLEMPDDAVQRFRGGRMRLERSEFHPGGTTRRDLMRGCAKSGPGGW